MEIKFKLTEQAAAAVEFIRTELEEIDQKPTTWQEALDRICLRFREMYENYIELDEHSQAVLEMRRKELEEIHGVDVSIDYAINDILSGYYPLREEAGIKASTELLDRIAQGEA